MKLLTNANIFTQNPDQPKARDLLIDHGQIIAVGNAAEWNLPLDCTRQDMGGKTIWPGLTDAHLHLDYYAQSLQKVDCETATLQECLRRVAERAAHTPPGEWILGHGWNQNSWKDGFPNAGQLDQIAPRHPVYLTAKSLHAGWVNTQAMRQANIQAATPNPQGGEIQHDANRQPTGILLEGAMELAANAVPQASPQQSAQAILAAQQILWRMGITGVHDFDRRRCFQALQILHGQNQLRLRVLKNIPLDDLGHALAIGLRGGFGDEWLRIGGVKGFADGALGPHTAAMLAPYADEPNNRGALLLDSEEVFEAGRKASQNGYPMTIHAIGDRANHEVLIGYAQLREFERANHLPRLRHRIEHVQVLHPNDTEKLGALQIVASMQPSHAISDMVMADRLWGERAALSYAWKAQLQAGAALAFGSDAPVESPNPFEGLHAALTRRRADGSPGPQGWRGEQRLTLSEGLRAFTIGAAYAAGTEKLAGQLAPGFWADLIVLERDPFLIPQKEIRELKPVATMIGGEWVYENSGTCSSYLP